MDHLLLVGSPASRPALLRRLTATHRVTVLGVGPAGGEGYQFIDVPDYRPATLVRATQGIDGRLRGVVCWEQLATFSANQVAAALGLPTIWSPPATNLVDKAELYALWERHGVPCPSTVRINPGDPPPAGRCVVKPGALMGAIGTRLCHDEGEAAAQIEALGAALTGRGPDRWAGELLRRHDLPPTILAQRVVPVDRTADGERLEYSAEVAVARGEPRLICVFAKTHVGPPYFAESTFLLPPPATAAVWTADVADAVYSAVGAAGVCNGVVEVEFCLSAGRIMFFELNPRLIGEPAPAAMEYVFRVPVADLVAALAADDRSTAWRLLDLAAPRPQAYVGFVDVRADDTLAGQVFRGLEPGPTPLPRIDATPVLTNGETIRVSPLRGPARVSTVLFRAVCEDERAAWLAHWRSPAAVRTTAPRAMPKPGGGSVDLAFVDGTETLSTMDWIGYARPLSLSPPWLTLSARLPELIRLVSVVLVDGDGPLAGLPCWICTHACPSYDPFVATGLAPRQTAGPIILAGSRIGYRSTPLLRPGLSAPGRRAALARLVEGVRVLADREGAGEAWWMYADSTTARDLSGLATAPPLYLPPTAVLASRRGYPQWPDPFDRRGPARPRDAAGRWDQDELDLRMEPMAGVVDDAAGLLAAHNRGFGDAGGEEDARAFLALHASAFDDGAVAFAYREAGVLHGFACAVEWRDQLAVRAFAERDGQHRVDGLYVHLAIHLPLRLAALRAIPSVDLGPGRYRDKLLYGAALDARWAVPLATRGALGQAERTANLAHIHRQLADVSWRPPQLPQA